MFSDCEVISGLFALKILLDLLNNISDPLQKPRVTYVVTETKRPRFMESPISSCATNRKYSNFSFDGANSENGQLKVEAIDCSLLQRYRSYVDPEPHGGRVFRDRTPDQPLSYLLQRLTQGPPKTKFLSFTLRFCGIEEGGVAYKPINFKIKLKYCKV